MDFRVNIINRIEKWTTIFFFSASIFIMFLLMQALILTWLSQFKILYLSLSVVISSILTIIFLHVIKKDINSLPRISIQVIGIIMLVCLIGILFPHETFGGRDEGSYSGMAIMLSNNNNLFIPSYLHDTNISADQNLVSFSIPTYIVWLAIQNIFFGMQWMLRSNIILVALGLCSLYFVSSLFTKKSLSFIVVILYSSCMPFLWFFRETMTENIAFFFLWTSIAFLFTFFRTKRNIYLVGLILGMWLFSFTRLEGLLIQVTTFLVFSSILLFTKAFPLKRKLLTLLVYFVIIVSSLLASKSFANNSYLNSTIPNVEFLLKRSIPSVKISENVKKYNDVIPKEIRLTDRMTAFAINMLAKYNLVIVLFSIFLIIPLIAIDKKMGKNNKIYLIGLLFILSPEFYKFIDPSVTMEQPWMYRRYLYALLPMGYLCFTILLSKRMSRKFMLFLTAVLFIVNILLSRKILFIKNNWSMSEQLDEVIKNISPKEDFVIIKEWTILNNYYPTTYLTYFKDIRAVVRHQIVNGTWLPETKKFKGVPYNKLFLLSDKEAESFEDFKLSIIDNVVIKYKQLEPNCILPILNSDLGLSGANLYSLPYQDSIAFCSKTDNDILDVEKKIYLYELTNKK